MPCPGNSKKTPSESNQSTRGGSECVHLLSSVHAVHRGPRPSRPRTPIVAGPTDQAKWPGGLHASTGPVGRVGPSTWRPRKPGPGSRSYKSRAKSGHPFPSRTLLLANEFPPPSPPPPPLVSLREANGTEELAEFVGREILLAGLSLGSAASEGGEGGKVHGICSGSRVRARESGGFHT